MRIGFDLGGTKMLAAVIGDDRAVLAREKTPTNVVGNDAVLAAIIDTTREAIRKAGVDTGAVRSMGIAVPGPIDTDRGIVLQTPNVGITQLPLSDLLRKEFGFSVRLENDVNAGLWGEYVAGVARGFSQVIGIFPGTGIGGGLILDGHLFRGKKGGAGEIGHITVQSDGRRCGCGNHGCLETVASKTAIARDLAILAMNGQSQVLVDADATDIKKIKSGLIAKALKSGDPGVAEIVDQAAEFLGIGMATAVNLFDPELIVLGGGLIEKLGDRILPIAESTMRARAMPRLVDGVVVRIAELGDDAVVLGAADLAGEWE